MLLQSMQVEGVNMARTLQRAGKGLTVLFIGAMLIGSTGGVYANDTRGLAASTQDELWQQTVSLVKRGAFRDAAETIERIQVGGELTEQVRTWLEEYEVRRAARRALDLADFEKYVGYAKARIDRKEYDLALGWTALALDCAEDRDAVLEQTWIQELVNDALTAAETHRKDRKWRKAWHIYSQLAELFPREPRYEKLERDVLTHLRLDRMFRKGSHWEEQIEKVRWRDAKVALEHIDLYYVHPADFKAVAESGLEQLLLLAESKTAREQFEGLANDDDRRDFELRIQERLEQIRGAPTLDRGGCVMHFRRVIKSINEETVRLPEELVVHELMRGALEPLDDFTDVIWPADSKEFDKHTRGDFVGVGISIIKNRAGEVEVVTPLEDSSAYRAGIQAGDIITKVEGTLLKDFSLNKVVDTITGPAGTKVSLTIRRDGKETEYQLERAKVKIRSVKGVQRDPEDEERWDHWLDREHGIGYVRILNFQRNTVEDVDEVLSAMPGLKGLVLDLRGNPGGLLDAAWELSTRFLKRGDVVVSTKGRIPSENHVFDVPGNGPYRDIPLVVLVDERSASASEIVSGAIRDNHRGIVIGERTYGKFSVQNLIPLSRSSGAKLKITTAGYYLPSGVSFHRGPDQDEWGVGPDIPVHLVRKETWKVYEMWRDANLLGPAKPTDESETDADDEDAADETAAPDDDDDADESDGTPTDQAEDAQSDPERAAQDGAGASADEDEEDEEEDNGLPQLDQPDENDRPKQDPQLDTALLFMRITLVGKSYPTLATAEAKGPVEQAKP
jgi:carboxyl-terminal processing protease